MIIFCQSVSLVLSSLLLSYFDRCSFLSSGCNFYCPGLKRYWRRKREENGEQEPDADFDLPTMWSLPQHHPDEVVLHQVIKSGLTAVYHTLTVAACITCDP